MDVPEGWKRTELGTLADVAYGLTVNKQRREAKERAPYLRVANVKAGQLDLSEVKDMGVIGDDVERYRLHSKDILLVEGNGNPDLVGAACIWRNELTGALHQNHLIRIRATTALVIPEWLLFSLNSAAGHQQILGHAKTSSGLYTINSSIVRQLQLQLPPLTEQRKIAAILTSVDEAIEKTQAVIDQVQVVKKSLMQELLTRGLPGRHTKFKQTEIGEIPASWEVVELGDALDGIEAGWSPQCESHPPENGEWGVLKVSAVSGGYYRAAESKKYSGSAPPRPEIEVCVGDVLLGRASGVLELVGKTVFVERTRPMLMLSDKTLRLRPVESQISNRFLHNIMSHAPVREQLLNNTGGSHMRNVSQAAIKALIIPLPPLQEQSLISSAERSISIREESESKSLLALQQLKQALMSVLLTGELRVTP